MTGYKVFNPNWTCKGFKYEVGKTYTMNKEIKCCHKGFHFCKELKDCFYYYTFNYNNKFAIVEANDKIISDDEEIFCTNNITIVKELSFTEVCRILGFSEKISRLLTDTFCLTKSYEGFRCVLLGGHWISGAGAGPFCWNLTDGSSNLGRVIGARLINNRIELLDYWEEKIFGYITEEDVEIIENYEGKFSKEEIEDYCNYLRKKLFRVI